MINRKALRLVACLLLFSSIICAQNPQIFDTSNSKLPDANLWSIAIDHDGNKWIGTGKFGVVKYDGKTFTGYNKDNSPIKGNFISSIYVDKKNNVWASFSRPFDGLAKFDGSAWTVYTAAQYPGLSSSAIILKGDEKGKMYFGTYDGIITYDGSTWSRLKLPGEPTYVYDVLAMDISNKGEIAAGHSTGLLLYDGQNWESLNENNSELQVGTVRSVKFMDNGDLYIGYGGGLGKGGFSILENGKWKHSDKNNSALPDQMVRDIEVSKNGIIWMGTNDGILKIDGNKFKAIKFWSGKYHNVIMGLAIENDKTVWVATPHGLVKYN